MNERVTELKVLFIIGKGRSGSTLIDNALGGIDGVLSLGEAWVWGSRRRIEDHECGCGRKVGECPLWSEVLQAAYRSERGAGTTQKSREVVFRWQQETTGWKRVPRLLRAGGASRVDWEALDELAEFAGDFYRAAALATGAGILVDSSKWPANPGPLGLIPGIRPYIVHLVRDPRAVAFSWQRSKRWSPSGEPMPKQRPLFSSMSWVARNVLADRVRRRHGTSGMTLRYEDFVANPGAVLHKLTDFIGLKEARLPLMGERTLHLGPNHTLMGNPSRFSTGPVEIRPDDEWRQGLTRRDHALVTTVTWPLLGRYGYN